MMTKENDTYKYDAFISYNHKDKEWVQSWLLPKLEEAGLRVCIDFRDFEPGLPSLVNMENAVERSRKMLIVLTPEWTSSEWTLIEALLVGTYDPAGLRRRIIPLLLKPCQPPKRIAMLTYIDFTQAGYQTEAWERLLKALRPRLYEPAESRIEDLQRQLLILRRNLAELEEMRAVYGPLDVPLSLLNQINETKETIRLLEAELMALTEATEVPREAEVPTISGEIQSLKRQIELQRSNLLALQERRASFGVDVPTSLLNEISRVKEELARLEEVFSELEPRPRPLPPGSSKGRSFIEILGDPVWQGIGALVAVISLLIAILSFIPDISLLRTVRIEPAWVFTAITLPIVILLVTYSARVVASRWAEARLSREREMEWHRWEQEIEKLLFVEGEASPAKLPEIPEKQKIFAIEKYFRDHRNQLAISLRRRDHRLELENRHLTSRFTTSWDKASAYLRSLDKGSFLEACSDMLDCLHDLGIHRCEIKPTTFGRLHGFTVEVPSLSLNIPQRFPIVFAQKEEFSVDDVEDVVGLKSQMGMEDAYFIVLVVFNRATDAEEEIQPESSVYGIEFCVLDRSLLWNFLISRTGEKDLTKMLTQKASLLRICPYRIYGPAPDPVFFGREREISRVLASVREASIAIVGGRKIGKTSTLNKIERALSKRGDVYLVYLDCYRIRDYEAFFDKVDTNLGELELPKATRDPLRFDSVVGSIQREIGSKRLVFLMDEVDALLDYDTRHNEDLFGTFRSLSQEGKCSFVLCGAKVLYFSLHNPRSALFNFCDTLRLGCLDAKNSAKLITVPMARMGVHIQDERVLVDKIISITSGHPNLIQFICRRMIELIDREHRRNITLDDFTVVSGSAEFREFFTEVIWGDTSPLERLIMLSLVEGKELSKAEIINALDNEGVRIDLRQLQEAIRGLRLYSIIVSVGNRYTFTAKAFPDIVKYSQNIDLLRRQYKKEWEETKE